MAQVYDVAIQYKHVVVYEQVKATSITHARTKAIGKTWRPAPAVKVTAVGKKWGQVERYIDSTSARDTLFDKLVEISQ